MNKKMILSVISVLLVFATVFSFAGCNGDKEDATTTTVITAKNALPTDITTSYDEASNLITDTTYTPEQLQANTAQIFNYINDKMGELKTGYVAKVSMSQSKGIGGASEFYYLTQDEIKTLVLDEALVEYADEVDERLAESDGVIADAKEAADKAAEKLEKAKAKGNKEKIEQAEIDKKIADRLYQEAIAAKKDLEKGKKTLDEKLFDGSNFDVLSNEQFEIVEGYAQSKGITFTFYPGNKVKATRRDGVAMTGTKNDKGEYENGNEYIEATIKSLDSYMLSTDGFSTEDYVNVADYIPLAGQANAWTLSLDNVKSATCVDADGQRTITITLKGTEFEDIIEQQIIEGVYNVETVKNPEILEIDGRIGEANDKINEANDKIEAADKAIAKAEKKGDKAALDQAKADKAKAEADKTKYTLEKKDAEKEKRDALSLKTIDENIDDIMKEFDGADKYLDITKKPVLQYKDCQIIISMNLETEEIHTIQYKKSVDVSTEVTGKGNLADVGVVPVNFNYNSTVTYNLEKEVPEETTTAAK